MGTYYSFMYIDLDVEKTPWDNNKKFYLLENRASVELLDNPILMKTTNNYLVKNYFSSFVKQNTAAKNIEILKVVFGNMFWSDVLKIDNQNVDYYLNHWELEWQTSSDSHYIGFLDYYSIHQQKIKTILDKLSEIDLENYFAQTRVINMLNTQEDRIHRSIIQGWINMYKTALAKSKGVVFDIN